jgi:hypothetical protein
MRATVRRRPPTCTFSWDCCSSLSLFSSSSSASSAVGP